MLPSIFPKSVKSILIVLSFITPSFFLTSCLKNVENRGYTIEQADIDTIRPGISSKEEVLQALGSPTSRSLFGQENWYYITSKTESIAFLNPKVVEQHIIAVTFDTSNKVHTVHQYSLKDAQKVQFAKDVTPTEGSDMTILQQILGNVGRFNPDGMAPRTSPRNRIPGR